MSRARPPEGIEIAALKKQQQTVTNFMASGPGTPWEDRGSKGTLGAFISSSIASMTSPGKLVDQIRRPETTNDATAYVIGCSVLWGISAAMHTAILLWRESKNPTVEMVNTTDCGILVLIALLAAGGGCYMLFKIYNVIYAKLVTQEKDSGQITDTLVYNVNAYAMGASLLCIIPVVGPFIGLIGILISAIGVGQGRLKLKFAAAVIDAVISYLAVLAIAGAVWYAGKTLLGFTELGNAIQYPDKTAKVDGTPGSTPAAPGATP